ncbi:MAG: hypothetical protein V2I33_18865, partial [Kangiellaceae bacterium]|nr:hypothetical protein [Kangiellaceae bacterium]
AEQQAFAFDRTAYPKVCAWHDKLTNLPAVSERLAFLSELKMTAPADINQGAATEGPFNEVFEKDNVKVRVASTIDAYEKGMSELNHLADWESVFKSDSVIGFSRSSATSEINTLKVEFVLDRPFKAVADYYFSNYATLHKDTSPYKITQFDQLSVLTENARCYQVKMSLCWPCSDRSLTPVGLLIDIDEDSMAFVGTSRDVTAAAVTIPDDHV